jgi:hypothetical protein
VKRALLMLAALVLLVLITGCSLDPNYSGKGNAFDLRATITRVGQRSITVRVLRVTHAEGKARHWFGAGSQHQIHNNYNTCGWHARHTVGRVFHFYRLSIHDLFPGEHVIVEGRIRQNAAQCGKGQHWKWRPVYDRVVVL